MPLILLKLNLVWWVDKSDSYHHVLSPRVTSLLSQSTLSSSRPPLVSLSSQDFPSLSSVSSPPSLPSPTFSPISPLLLFYLFLSIKLMLVLFFSGKSFSCCCMLIYFWKCSLYSRVIFPGTSFAACFLIKLLLLYILKKRN